MPNISPNIAIAGARPPKRRSRPPLCVNLSPEHLFSLKQSLEFFDFHHEKITECDLHIEALLTTLSEQQPEPDKPIAKRQTLNARNTPKFKLAPLLMRMTGGRDLTAINSIDGYAALKLVSEIGINMTRWRTEKHFCSWITLAPTKQNYRRQAHQFKDTTGRQSRRRITTNLCRDPGPIQLSTRCLLSANCLS